MPTESICMPVFDPLMRKEHEGGDESVCVGVVAHRYYFNFLECLLPSYYPSLKGSP